ncbi:Mu transposase C-terminal domain-containing protein [Peribacillus sp. SCS-155]|uniref:Mu transposase C-terminal domain-containing protein n=1 Tax=Peribacillus sedimenti TaxID=3115297 RepID=UPI0039063146
MLHRKYDAGSEEVIQREALYPLHIVEIDYVLLDIDVYDESGYIIGRPWLTLGVDVYSGAVWCYFLSLEGPSKYTLINAIQHGILPVKEKLNTCQEWEVFGIPDTIEYSLELNNKDIQVLVNETLKSNIIFNPVRPFRNRSRAALERVFGSINSVLTHLIQENQTSRVQELGAGTPKHKTFLTLHEVKESIVKYITNISRVDHVRGIKRKGNPITINEDKAAIAKIQMLPEKYKPYTRRGVQLDHILYRTPELNHLIAGPETKYIVKFDNHDVSSIYLLDPTINKYVLVPAVNLKRQ